MCDICGTTLYTKEKLKSHIASVHKGKQSFKCEICDAEFATKHKMKGHMASIHEGKKPFKCDNCDAAFTRYFFNQELQSCQSFIWGGCGGIVPFLTLDDCLKSCGGQNDLHDASNNRRTILEFDLLT